MNNAVRHANARTVEVAVRKEGRKVNVTVQDDGAGFDTRFMRGLGLLGMEERVRRLGGRLKISSRAGARDAGSRGRCRWPNWTKGTDMKPIRILLADDHTVVRDGLRALLERESDMTVVAEAADGRESVRLAETEAPDVVVMDLAMPNMNGMEATRRILAANSRVGVVILSMHQDESYVLGALKAGAKGYLLKDSMRGEVVQAIRAVSQGRSFLTRKVARILQEDYIGRLQQRGLEDRYDLLSDREREVLQIIAEGRSNKEVANLLNISLTTVETHRAHILQKLDIHSIPELILYAVRKGIIS